MAKKQLFCVDIVTGDAFPMAIKNEFQWIPFQKKELDLFLMKHSVENLRAEVREVKQKEK